MDSTIEVNGENTRIIIRKMKINDSDKQKAIEFVKKMVVKYKLRRQDVGFIQLGRPKK